MLIYVVGDSVSVILLVVPRTHLQKQDSVQFRLILKGQLSLDNTGI